MDHILEDTAAALAAVDALAGGTIPEGHPELAALAVVPPDLCAVEQEPSARPLLDHLRRVLDRKLIGLERGERERFQRGAGGLSEAQFAAEVAVLRRVAAAGLLPCVRAALLHLDFAKGGSPQQRAAWESLGVELGVHNQAAADILRATGSLRRWPGIDERLVIALVESHGLAGQAVRGETPEIMFERWRSFVRADGRTELATDCLHLVNLCDTAGVREGLVDDALAAEMRAVVDRVAAGAGVPEAWPRPQLADRLARLRQGRQKAGEPRAAVDAAVAALSDAEAARLAALLRCCQLWYFEAATGGLSAEAALAVLRIGVDAAAAEPGIDTEEPYHVSLQPLVAMLHGDDARVRYRQRLVEAMLGGEAPRAAGLGTFTTRIGGQPAIALGFADSEEAAALLTLLAIYERKSSAHFHQVLKMLCDLYGLRKDELDRVANEHSYLATMNAARSDKQRILDFARPGRIVEIGPGGGVILDLAAERYPDSEVIGIDSSSMAVDALRARQVREGRRWSIIHADAFELPRHVGPGSLDTVIFCSILHEIYSYVEPRFSLDSVRRILHATWECLRPGGRLIIRDGVAPPAGTRLLRFVAPDSREFFDLFCAQFEGLKMEFTEIGDGRVRLPAHHAMEFLYTYTWGPDSFPYEVREQYGVLPYAEYIAAILGWLPGARAVDLPPDLRSYLQDGYNQGLAGKVELFDERGVPCALPDSNCVMVFEKA